MEETMRNMSKSLATFCNNLQSSSDALKQSLDRRPIPLDSASTTFIQSLNRRVSALSADLNLVESMTLGTVSFEELLGHCHELFKHNQSTLSNLHCHLLSQGYLPSDDGVDEFEEDFMSQGVPTSETESPSGIKSLEETVKGASKNEMVYGLLATNDLCVMLCVHLGERKSDVLDSPPKLYGLDSQNGSSIPSTLGGEEGAGPESHEASKLISVSENDYENLPSYMKALAPWEDIQSAVEKINSYLSKKANLKQTNFFHPEELESMGLGMSCLAFIPLLVFCLRN
ncbi:hypothetical protein Cgig2_012828 [Carnegiea gigantea]|uniref:Spindle and kinetochore-associated protein 3 n=1 Tax=Carnegiea gigantea TaxID=171969 RepID=A0A9Q1K9R2_9CARY|nr:hypothetical protein Cgig2_012828 [Carnegiea gigantea]